MRTKVGAGVASVSALLALWLAAGGLLPGPSPVTPGAANLWIDNTSGSCTRAGTPGAHDDAAACGSAQTAYNAASCGDVVRYQAGTYSAEQVIARTTTGKNCTSGQEIVFRPEDDAVNSYGVASSVVLPAGIGLDAINCTCRFEDFDTYVDTGLPGAATDTQGMIGSNRGSTTKGSVKAEFRRIDAHLGYIAQVQDVTIKDGSIGDWDSCVDDAVDGTNDLDGLKIWGVTGWSDRITVDGTIFHNIRKSVASPPCDFHTDGIQVGSGSDITLKNLRMYDMPTSGILARPQAGTPLEDFTVENNMLGPITDGTNGILACNSGDDCDGITVRYNTLGFGDNIVVRDGNAVIVGNSTAAGYSLTGTSLVSDNVYTTATPGGTNAYSCTPTWADDEDPDLGQLHIDPADTCHLGRGNDTNLPATDFDGDARPLDDPDIGADEIYAGTGLRLSGAGHLTYPATAVDLSDTAYTTFILWRPRGADGSSMTLLSGETSANNSHWAMYRLGTGFWIANSLGLYRLVGAFEDLVWTEPLTTTLSDGLVATFIAKPLGGGTCSPANQGSASCPTVHQYKVSGGAWVHDTGSPGKFQYQLANGDPLGVGGTVNIGAFEGTTDELDGDVYAAAIFESQLSTSTVNAIMATPGTQAAKNAGAVWATDFGSNLQDDEVGTADLSSSAGTTQAPGIAPSLWAPGVTP